MYKSVRLLTFLFLCVSASVYGQQQLETVLPIDPKLIKGKLSNGLTYFIRENKKPEKKSNSV